jgi:hypothetical protein
MLRDLVRADRMRGGLFDRPDSAHSKAHMPSFPRPFSLDRWFLGYLTFGSDTDHVRTSTIRQSGGWKYAQLLCGAAL